MLAFLQRIDPRIFFFGMLVIVSAIAAAYIYTNTMKEGGEKLKESGYSNLAFELTFSDTVAKDILSKWGEKNLIETAHDFTKRDFWFIPAYVLLFVSLTLLVRSCVGSGCLLSAGLIFVLASLVAGLFDVIENFFLLSMLKGNVTWRIAMGASSAAFLKFMLLINTFLYWVVSIGVCLKQLIWS